ncbi:MAG: DUF1549 domain-containing protein [Verrucomicrobia bacterium]|nr:DUF1549 domain-containing protein [Verrucomicrobiota bacterium]
MLAILPAVNITVNKRPKMTAAFRFALAVAVAARSVAAVPAAPGGAELFEQKIQPILQQHCFKCHSHAADKIKGGLVLDSFAAILAGGDTGPAIVPGKPAESLLLSSVKHAGEFKMPKKGDKLSAAEIAVLEEWVKLGAPAPKDSAGAGAGPKKRTGKITDEDRKWWAYQPVRQPAVPEVKGSKFGVQGSGFKIQNPVDNFILARLEKEGLQPSPEADRATLVRRLYFDVIGLPPTPVEVDAFLKDKSPDAYEKLVDKLLASPRHGEKWARHWLDLVRYAESDGYKADDYRAHSWRYRDYVVESFNSDKPYDRFVQEQIAGDELFPGNPEATVATSYYRHGIYEYNNRDVRGQWQRILEDITDTTADVFLGAGLQCARCHDHKFDPILQKDYYRLQAFFAPLLPREDLTLATPQERAAYQAKLVKWEAATADIRAELEQLLAQPRKNAEKSAQEKFIEDIREMMAKPAAERAPYEDQIARLAYRQVVYEFDRLDTRLKGDVKERVLALRKKLTEFDSLKPEPLPPAVAVTDVGPVAPPTTMPKGSKELVPPGYLTVLDEKSVDVKPLANSTGRRAELARWLTQPENPLTARVIVNRLWQWHFGRGLAANTSDFGKLGEQPSHPELLDWLTAHFVADGWSLKKMHKLLLMSATWRQSSVESRATRVEGQTLATRPSLDPRPSTLDPENKLYWRGSVRRLEAEQIRDAILSVTGELKLNGGGPSTDFLTPRRTIYSKMMRNARDPLLDVFDLAEAFQSVSQRNATTTPTQALLLFNSQTMLRHARAFAKRVEEEYPSSEEEMAKAAFQLAFGRTPRPAELAAAVKFISDQTTRTKAKSAIKTTTIPTEKMPYRDGVAAVISPEMGSEELVVPDSETMPKGDFTIEAAILVRSVDTGGTVRTIAAKWDGSTKKPGWGFAVTGAGSRRKPQTLVMQIIGTKQDGSFGEEAIFSDQSLTLGKPYFVAAAVKLATATQPGEVMFYVKDLGNDDEPVQIARVSHKITGGFQNQLPLNLGGRAAKSGGFDGMIDDVRLTTGALAETELLPSHDAATDATAGFWQFEAKPSAYRDASAKNNDIRAPQNPYKAAAQARSAALADFCHALLNSNEFLYVD